MHARTPHLLASAHNPQTLARTPTPALHPPPDAKLAANTADFEALETAFNQLSGDEAEAAAQAIKEKWERVQPEVNGMLERYRALHAELKALKAAVNKWVAEHNAKDGAV